MAAPEAHSRQEAPTVPRGKRCQGSSLAAQPQSPWGWNLLSASDLFLWGTMNRSGLVTSQKQDALSKTENQTFRQKQWKVARATG